MRALILFSALAMFAQQPAVFRTSTKLVVVNVTVRDKSGKVIDDLGKEDFTLLEDGKPQAISVFELEHLSSDVLPPAPAPGLKIRTATPVPADNRPAAPATTSRKDRRLLALFFDLSSMQPPEQIRAKDAALKFLREQMTASDLVSILTFSNRLNVVEEFTDDRERLIADIQRFRVGESSERAGRRCSDRGG